MFTPYSSQNQTFSDKGHMCAQDTVYPLLFKTEKENLLFTCTSLNMGEKQKILDGEMAIDRIVSVKCKNLSAPLEFTFQERFRRIEYKRYQDFTVTEWNYKSDQKSELYKLNAGFFLYGYFDEKLNQLQGWIVIKTADFLLKMVNSEIPYETGENKRTLQSFFCFKFKDLLAADLVVMSNL